MMSDIDLILGLDDESLLKTPPEKEPEGFDPIDMIMGTADMVQREFSPRKNEISTITGKPVVDYTPTGQPSTKMGALAKSGFVDDPKGKIKIFAESRGIPEDRYSIYEGEIVYQGDDGKWYPETKNTLGGKVKEIVGESPAFMPSGILGAAGATVGPGMAFMGAAGGEGLRQYIGDKMTDTETDPKQGLLKMGTVGLTGLLGMGGGKATKGTINSMGAKRGGLLASHAGRNRALIDTSAARELEKVGEDVGVNLFPPQTTGSKALADKFNLLGDLEASAPIIQGARKKQYGEIDKAVNKFLDYLSPRTGSPISEGKDLVGASKSVIQSLKTARSNTVKPLYNKVKDVDGVDISSTVKKIDELMSETKPGLADHKALTRIKRLLTKKVEDEKGDLVVVPEDRLVIIDKVKKDINAKWRSDPKNAPAAETQYQLNQVMEDMLSAVDEQVPDYKIARDAFKEASPAVKAAQKSKVGELAKLDGDKGFTQAASKLFSSVGNSPEAIRKAKVAISSQNKEAWDAAVRTHLENLFYKTKGSAGGADLTENIGGNFFKKTWGDPSQRKILRAAMDPDQFDYFKKLTTVLDRAGMILRKESATATRQEMIDEIGGSFLRRTVRAATRPMVTKERVVADMLVKARLGQNAKTLANAMISKRYADRLNKMYQLGPRSEKLIPMLSTFAAIITGGELKSSHAVKKAEPKK